MSRVAVASRQSVSRQAVTRAALTQYYVQKTPSIFPCDWDTTPGNWSVSGGTKTGNSTAFKKNATQSLVVTPSTTSCVVSRSAGSFASGVRPDLSAGGVVGLWVYLQSPNGEANGASNAFVNLTLSNTFNFTNTLTAGFAGNHVRWNQWNYLPLHTGETGATNAQGTGSAGWTQAGTGTFASKITDIQIQLGNMSGAVVYLDSISFGLRSRPKIMFGFDAVSSTLTTSILPLLQSRGITGFVTANMNAGGLTTNTAQALTWKAAGWEIINHGTAHLALGTLTDDDAITAEIAPNWTLMQAAGLIGDQEKIFFAPQNSTSPRVKRILASLGYVAGRAFKNFNIMTTPFGVDSLLEWGAFDCGNPTSRTRLLDLLDAAVVYGCSTNFFVHDVNTTTGSTGATGNANTIYIDDVTAMLDKMVTLRQQGKVDLVTPTQWYRGLTTPRLSA